MCLLHVWAFTKEFLSCTTSVWKRAGVSCTSLSTAYRVSGAGVEALPSFVSVIPAAELPAAPRRAPVRAQVNTRSRDGSDVPEINSAGGKTEKMKRIPACWRKPAVTERFCVCACPAFAALVIAAAERLLRRR